MYLHYTVIYNLSFLNFLFKYTDIDLLILYIYINKMINKILIRRVEIINRSYLRLHDHVYVMRSQPNESKS